MLGYYAIHFFSKIMCVLPLCLRKLFASFVGSVAVLVVQDWRLKMAQANVEECLGVSPERAKQIARDSLRRFGRMAVEVLRFPLLNKDNISQNVHVEGLEHLEKAYAEGKGVIMCTGHYGNWELLGATVALHGYPMLSITRKQNNANMDKAINEFRQMVGQKVTYNRGGHGLLAISRMLKEKNLLGVLYDQDTNDDGVEVDNVYYDNIVNVNIYRGASKIFGRDFRKEDFDGQVPHEFLKQAILSDIVLKKVDTDGLHYRVVLAMPDSSVSYQVEIIISLEGKMTIKKS